MRVTEDIARNIEKVMQRIENACSKCGRDPSSVRLVAVTKTILPQLIRDAVAAGVGILGENYLQEAQRKIEELGHIASWHFIGHLQKNKARRVVELFDMIHTLDSLSLADALEKAAARVQKVVPLLIQVNISGETSKHGIHPQGVEQLIEYLHRLPHLRVAGLMTIPPLLPSPEDSRPYYIALRRLRDDLIHRIPGEIQLGELSMGMSADFEVAIEEGATLIRVGTAIFGPRH